MLAPTHGVAHLFGLAVEDLLSRQLELALEGEVSDVGGVLANHADFASHLALVAAEGGVVLGLAQRLELLSALLKPRAIARGVRGGRHGGNHTHSACRVVGLKSNVHDNTVGGIPMFQFLFGVAFGAAGYWAWQSFGRDLLGMGGDQGESTYGGFSSSPSSTSSYGSTTGTGSTGSMGGSSTASTSGGGSPSSTTSGYTGGSTTGTST